MAIAMRLKNMLEENNISYQVLTHSEVYSTSKMAQLTHISGKEIAKSVILKLPDGTLIQCVIPASRRVDFNEIYDQISEGSVLAVEEDFKDMYEDVELGAMHPFGILYGIEVWCDKDLSKDEYIYFNGGNHHEIVKIKYSDFERLAKPVIKHFIY